jgi:hypothetical protein
MRCSNRRRAVAVVWGGEFGRTPGAQGNDARDLNAKGFSM